MVQEVIKRNKEDRDAHVEALAMETPLNPRLYGDVIMSSVEG